MRLVVPNLEEKAKKIEKAMEENRKQCAKIAQEVNKWGNMRQVPLFPQAFEGQSDTWNRNDRNDKNDINLYKNKTP